MAQTTTKPRLTHHELEALLLLHNGGEIVRKKGCPLFAARVSLFSLGLACYMNGWVLTLAGKQLARHLTGKK